MQKWLLRKITRERLSDYLDAHPIEGLVIEIGASSRPSRDRYAPLFSSDLIYNDALDLQNDAHHLPFAANSIPNIVCLEVLEHCHTPQRVIDECYRVLQPNGTLILTTRFVYPIHDAPYDYFRYTKYGLQHLHRAFSQVDVTPEAQSVETMGVLMQRLAYQADWRVPLTKVALLLMAKLMPRLQGTIRTEYGDIRKETTETDILASGYYVCATK